MFACLVRLSLGGDNEGIVEGVGGGGIHVGIYAIFGSRVRRTCGRVEMDARMFNIVIEKRIKKQENTP